MRKNFLEVRGVQHQLSLPQEVVNSSLLEDFKYQLDTNLLSVS